jgi:hypothetical protein
MTSTPVLASMAGSELPWWTPLAVCAALLLVAQAYRWRHRPRRMDPPPRDESALRPADPVEPPVRRSFHDHEWQTSG